jgi:phage gpG-like protein
MAGPILQRTGSLKRSFQSDANKDRVRVFSDSEIMPYHQLGQGSNPRRRMLAFSERLKQEVVGIFVKFVHEALDANPRTKR